MNPKMQGGKYMNKIGIVFIVLLSIIISNFKVEALENRNVEYVTKQVKEVDNQAVENDNVRTVKISDTFTRELLFSNINILLIFLGLLLIRKNTHLKIKMHNVGCVLLITGTLLTVTQYVMKREKIIIEDNKIESTILNQVGYLKKNVNVTYDAILSIPQISLKKGMYLKKEIKNNTDENIIIHELSDYPDEKNSNVILMVYFDTKRNTFLSKINQLNEDSLIEFYYQRTKYVYKIDHYHQAKITGNISIERDNDKKTITLITCSQEDKSKSSIYIGYLIDEIKYE